MGEDLWAARLRQAAAFGVPPGAFWTLSVREWLAVCTHGAGEVGASRARLSQLMARYPDQPAHPDQPGAPNKGGRDG